MNIYNDLYLENSLIGEYKGDNLFNDVYIEHNSLPEINFSDIDTKVQFMDKELSFPLIISSLTGGTENGLEINEVLSLIAKDLNIVFALGTKDENFENGQYEKMFLDNVDDDIKKDIIILPNFKSSAKKEYIDSTLKEFNSKGFYISLNCAQLAVSYDLDKNFKGVLENIKNLTNIYGDKVIVKEKSMGMSKSTVQKLVDAGVKYIDISGHGGSNFIELENFRNYRNDFSDLYNWGIPTAKSILNARSVNGDFKLIASGGIKTGLDIAKALILGADYVSVGGELLKYVIHGGYDHAKRYIEDLIYKTKIVMFLLGVDNIEKLKKVDYKIVGRLRELINE